MERDSRAMSGQDPQGHMHEYAETDMHGIQRDILHRDTHGIYRDMHRDTYIWNKRNKCMGYTDMRVQIYAQTYIIQTHKGTHKCTEQ